MNFQEDTDRRTGSVFSRRQQLIEEGRHWPLHLEAFLLANFFAVVAVFSLFTFAKSKSVMNAGNLLIYSVFVLVPAVMGIIAMWPARRIPIRVPEVFLRALQYTFSTIVLSAVVLREGVLCLIILSPLLYTAILIGMFIGRALFRQWNPTLQGSVLAIILALFFFDLTSEHDYVNEVTDRMVIDAPVSEVWKHVPSHPVNRSEPGFWLFRIGLPNPVQSTMNGSGVGATRKCVFSNNAVFDEVVVESVQDSLFTFDITRQPDDPEIIGHIELRRGRFILTDNGDGTTTLTGKSWYKLNVYPVWYFDIWAESITRQVHLRVMEHIKRLAEARS